MLGSAQLHNAMIMYDVILIWFYRFIELAASCPWYDYSYCTVNSSATRRKFVWSFISVVTYIFLLQTWKPVCPMSPAMTAAERLLAWHHSQLVVWASQPHYNVISLHPVICSTAAVRSSLYSSVFLMGFGDNKAYAVTNYNQQSSLKC